MMTRAQTVAVATAVQQCRPEWDHAGIVAALEKASTLGTPAEVAAAAFRLAGDTKVRTPGLLASPGWHWRAPAEGGPTVSVIPTRCPEHPQHRAASCPECAATPLGDPVTGAATVRGALRAAPRYVPPAVKAAQEAKRREDYQRQVRDLHDEREARNG